mgnify:FL=1
MAKQKDYPDRGNFRGFKNNKKEHGDDRPLFEGKLSLPGMKDERAFVLWAYGGKTDGATILSGKASEPATTQINAYTQPTQDEVQKIAAMLPARDGREPFKLDPDAIILFTNKAKNESEKNRPDYYGFYNPGDGNIQRLSVWSKVDRYGNPMLTGSLEAYERKQNREQEVGDLPPPAQPEPEMEHAR